MSSKGIIFYTSNNVPPTVAQAVYDNLNSIGLPIVSTSLKPIDFGHNIVVEGQKGYHTLFRQILTALENSTADIIFFCEHDNLYPKCHFEFTPPDDRFYYDRHWWKVRSDGLAVSWQASQVSGLCVRRETALEWYRNKVASFDTDNFDRKFEPPGDDSEGYWLSDIPYIDIRGNWNLTFNKWKLDHFRKKETAVNFKRGTIQDIPGWDVDFLKDVIE